MTRKSVAARAAELGTDQSDLVRALKALCVWRTKSNGWGCLKVPVMSLKEACKFLGLQENSAKQAIEASYPAPWSQDRVVDGIFAFMKREGEWPRSRDLRVSNGLPSWYTWELLANSTWVPYDHPQLLGQGWWRRNRNGWIRPRDFWERRVAADKRCTPQMAIHLRNVLARKEAIERIGFQTFIDKGLAELISDDPEYGTLYRLPGETPSEPMVLLKVVNATPDPDGSFSDYYLRVPPDMTNAREAVKWTFNGREALGSMPYETVMET